MEIPVINRISDFELNNPSLLSQVFTLSGIDKAVHAYAFWRWGALIIFLVATFSSIIRRIKILILNFRRESSPASQPLLQHLEDDDDYDTETTDGSYSSSEDEDDEPTPSSPIWRSVDEDFHVRGSGHYADDQGQNRNLKLLRRYNSIGDLFSWSELANGKSVVKLWDNLGLGLGLGLGLELDDNSSGNVISLYDLNKEQNIATISGGKCGIPALSTSSPAVVVSAETNEYRNIALRVWDTRVGCQIPAILAEWRPKLGKIIGVNARGLEKVYVSDDGTGKITVGDMRKVNSPLTNLTESDVDTWWDADAVIVSDELVDESE